MSDPWLIIDADYICHRAHYSMGDLSWKGAAIGVVYGFLQTIVQLEERFDTDKIAFCFDSRYSKRKEIYPAYKANRKKGLTEKEQKFEREFRRQVIKLRKEYLPEIGFRNVFMQGKREADDIIAALCVDPDRQSNRIIVTADEDLFQCITGHVSVYNPQKRILMTLQKFWNIYQIKPYQWSLVKAIAGCSSDNIPGVSGVGEKTALQYIRGTLKPRSKAINKIVEAQEVGEPFETYLKLVKLPLEGTIVPTLQSNTINMQKWRHLCKKLGFESLKLKMPKINRQKISLDL